MGTLGADEQKKEIAKFFRDVPIGKASIDFYSPDEWPTPWEILYYEDYCQNSISLLIYYTLRLLDHDAEILLVDSGDDRFLLVVSGEHDVFNYELGAISKWANLSDLSVLDRFNKEIKQIT